MTSKTYDELMKIRTLLGRYEYLKTNSQVGEQTFGSLRGVNQEFYRSEKYRSVRRRVIERDSGNELGHPDFPIEGMVFVHHINPLTPEDVINDSYKCYDMNNLICCSKSMHDAIHYGRDSSSMQKYEVIERHQGDTCPWR